MLLPSVPLSPLQQPASHTPFVETRIERRRKRQEKVFKGLKKMLLPSVPRHPWCPCLPYSSQPVTLHSWKLESKGDEITGGREPEGVRHCLAVNISYVKTAGVVGIICP